MKDKIIIKKGEISTYKTDAIICHANTELEMCEEISALLLELGGDGIQNECNRFDKLTKGQAVITQAGNLAAQHIIHAIVHNQGEEEEEQEEDLMLAIRNSLIIAREHNLKTIATPLIGVGPFGIPIKRAAELMMAEVKKHLDGETSLETVYFVAHIKSVYNAFEEAHKQL